MKTPVIISLAIIALFLTACGSSQPVAVVPSPLPTLHEDLPVYPGAEKASGETTGIYYYKISNTDLLDVQRFYENEMPKAGWEFLGAGDLSGDDIGKLYALWFAKGEAVATIEMKEQYHVVYVLIHLE